MQLKRTETFQINDWTHRLETGCVNYAMRIEQYLPRLTLNT